MTLTGIAAGAIAHALSVPLLRPLAATPTLPPAPRRPDTVLLRYA